MRCHAHTSWESVRCLAVLPDGTLASGSKDNTVHLWREGACVATLTGHIGEVLCLAVLPEGTLASGSHNSSGNKNLLIWS